MPSPELTPANMARSGLCIGCGACASRGEVTVSLDHFGQYRPSGNATPEAFAQLCPFSPAARNEDDLAAARFPSAPHYDRHLGRFEAAYVGATTDPALRENGSSGGLTSWVAEELLRRGLVDGIAHVAPRPPGKQGPLFAYRISRSVEALRQGARSRYYPVELSGVIAEIRQRPGRYAVIGIPCFIKAINLLRQSDPLIAERVSFLLGLFCGHMKSARFAESLMWQLGARSEEVDALEFRRKTVGRPANWYRAEITLRSGETRAEDWWHLADGDWGAGFFQNPACNFCDDVVAETADIAFGDAWVEPYQSDGRGTNVVVVRNAMLREWLACAAAEGRLDLTPVDTGFVVGTQAAGFRQRREGLAWRLARHRSGITPKKRVLPMTYGISKRRRAIYAMRQSISRWSHRMFWLARRLDRPGLYLGWARAVLRLYQGLTWSRGWPGRLFDRLLPRAGP